MVAVETASGAPQDVAALADRLRRRLASDGVEAPDTVITVGGNTAVLQALHRHAGRGVSIFGMSAGVPDFLTNGVGLEGLASRLRSASAAWATPLRVTCTNRQRAIWTGLAFNDVVLFRQSRRMVTLSVAVDGVVRLPALRGDGIILATPVGSTAYNQSAGGPILPLNAGALALTPLSPFSPRRWQGALLREGVRVVLRHGGSGGQIAATADFEEIRDIVEVQAGRTHPPR